MSFIVSEVVFGNASLNSRANSNNVEYVLQRK